MSETGAHTEIEEEGERERDKKCLKKMQHNYVFRRHYLTYIDCPVCAPIKESMIFICIRSTPSLSLFVGEMSISYQVLDLFWCCCRCCFLRRTVLIVCLSFCTQKNQRHGKEMPRDAWKCSETHSSFNSTYKSLDSIWLCQYFLHGVAAM